MSGPLAPVRGGGEVPLDTRQGSLQRSILTPHVVGRSSPRRRSIRVPALEHASSSRRTGSLGATVGEVPSSRGSGLPAGAAEGADGEPTSARESSRNELGPQRATRSPLGRSASMYSFPTEGERDAEELRKGKRASRRVANRSPPHDSRRQPTPRLIQDLVGYYMPREDLGKQGLMLDPELYTPNRLIQRDSCRFHPRVRRVLERIWRLSIAAQGTSVPGSGGGTAISKDTYLSMFRRVSRCLIRDFEPTQEWEDSVLAVDWMHDSGGQGSVDKEAYKLSWFQLADQWTPGISGDEYADFLESLLSQLTVPSRAPASAGEAAATGADAESDTAGAVGSAGERPGTGEGAETGEEGSLRLRDEGALAYMGPAPGPVAAQAVPAEGFAAEGNGRVEESSAPREAEWAEEWEGDEGELPDQQQQHADALFPTSEGELSAGREAEAPPPPAVSPRKRVQVAVPVAARVARQDSLWMDRYLGQAPTIKLRRGQARESGTRSETSSEDEEEVEPPHVATHTADATTWLGGASAAASSDATPRHVKPRSARAPAARRAAAKPRVAATGYGREPAQAHQPAGEVYSPAPVAASAAGVSPALGDGRDAVSPSVGTERPAEEPSPPAALPAASPDAERTGAVSPDGGEAFWGSRYGSEALLQASGEADPRPWGEGDQREPLEVLRPRGRVPVSPPRPVRLAPLPPSPVRPAGHGSAACMTSTPVVAGSRHGGLGTPHHSWCCPRSPLVLPSRVTTPPRRPAVLERHTEARRSLPSLQRPSTRRLGRYLDRLPPVDDSLARVEQGGASQSGGALERKRGGAKRPGQHTSPPAQQQHVASLRLLRAQPVMAPGPRFADPGGRLSLVGALSRQDAADREFMRPKSRWDATDTGAARLRRKYAARLKRASETRPVDGQQRVAPGADDAGAGVSADEAFQRVGDRAWERIALTHWLPRRVHDIHQGRDPAGVDADVDGSGWGVG